ncbi:hypothetical protein TREMEDRAFT_71704 [Tremella mesenterica DSM 1558]|uniref:uncharacterized protein n=1 Tax=Tremella mesenterica (strain ATCC 24925 / CBS 8224 / DSM 1558 / NBRC 9311 / NRRL Y-6157 / RJB 2259-6 / UBC 559-6) TaxID=578456 RepID=UPI0003F48C63|nr:uncharacterized protein TREMEDRAFT_71704 [Tremella mesenterica DSM 1558]EIW69663.1 hypothetical protein TREMEDRAFT_71704 [Tremella mesenterica DSM 1558]
MTAFGGGYLEPTGLFGYTSVNHPTSLRPLTERTIYHAQHIVEMIRKAPDDVTGRELRLVVKNLDRLSDLLCGVIDMAELIRNVHPDPTWVEESDKAYERLCSFMNELNTDTRLYQSLKLALQHPHSTPLSEAERQVALTFLRDFEKSGIHLPPDLRSRFVSQSDSLLSLGRTFLNDASSGPSQDPPIEIPEADRLLVGMGSAFISSLPRGKGKSRSSVFVTPGSWESQMIARYAREGEARRLVYVGSLRPDPDRIQVLEQMLLERAELANLLGKETWADVALVDKMAKTPGNVMNFLTSLAEHNRPAAATDIVMLQKMKASALTGNPFASETIKLPPIYAWDKDFFSERHMMSLSPVSSLPPITPYFSTGNIMLGLSRLFSKLYGISFKPVSVAPGEVWHPSVRRLEVVDEEEGIIGVIYCDLFSREGKPPSAAHYTVRCSRRVDDDDLLGDGLESYWDSKYGKGLEVEGEKVRGREGKYQLPIVVLTTDCGVVEEGRPAVLGWNDVETLFHEMGHAIHSMIGRTEYHNVSGTRCATDFVELPSILMEHFVSSPSVLSLFATHHTTNQPLPLPLLEAHLDIRDSLSSLETHGQILMAILDQRYHTIHHGDPFDSTKIHYDLQESLGVVPPVKDTAWQTQFGHLHGYGATYYSYLFDRAIAGKIWHSLFASNGGLSREGGEKFKDEVLRWGGGKDPWEMVANVIGGEEGDEVLKGDEGAMKVVGGWMIK